MCDIELFIIRHAESGNNSLSHIRDRVVDPPVTELGKRQAAILAQHLATGSTQDLIPGAASGSARARERKGYGITSLYCSPMLRSLQTAHPVKEALGLIPKVWVDIHERGGMYLDRGEGRGTFPTSALRPAISTISLSQMERLTLDFLMVFWTICGTHWQRLPIISRVLRPGGVVGIRSADSDGHIFAPPDPMLSIWFDLMNQTIERSGGNPRIGKTLRALLNKAGFVNVEASASYAHFGNQEALRLIYNSTIPIFFETDWADVDMATLENASAALKEWSKNPDAFAGPCWCEAVGWVKEE